jgi:hypothetical protein
MGPSDTTARGKPLVILMHGIRTRAFWYEEVRAELERSGFAVELTNFGKFSLLKFLLPISLIRFMVIRRVRKQIEKAAELHPGARVSFIAHSFGTFVLGKIIQQQDFEFPFEFKRLHRVILCGSVLPYDFDFGKLPEDSGILSEAGRKDYWPAIAERVTWGYGAAGTYGFHMPGVRDRYHNHLAHSNFLTMDFCKKYWTPYLRDGFIEPGDEHLAPQSFWMSNILFFLNKYVAPIVALFLIVFVWDFWIRSPILEVEIRSNGVYAHVGPVIQEMVKKIENDAVCFEFDFFDRLRQRRCVSIIDQSSEVYNLVACTIREPILFLESRDPMTIMVEIAARVPCLRLDGVERRRVSVGLHRDEKLVGQGYTDEIYWLCDCSENTLNNFDRRRLRHLR